MKIKICGITKIEEVKILNEEMPDYVGFVFAKGSKRNVTINQAKQLSSNLDQRIIKVGVFRDNSISFILDVVSSGAISIIQLHGNEDSDFVNELRKRTDCNIWKAISINKKEDINTINKYSVEAVLLDGVDPGSGNSFDWSILDGISRNKKVILAGGINESNIKKAISMVKPDVIDVSSGAEWINHEGIRIKSKEKIHNLIQKVR